MMKPFFAFFALFLCLAALWPVVTVSTAAQPEPYTGEPPVVADKLLGEDKPAEGSAELTIGEPLGEFKLTALLSVHELLRRDRRHHLDRHAGRGGPHHCR